jgi:hypothetical protein
MIWAINLPLVEQLLTQLRPTPIEPPRAPRREEALHSDDDAEA